MKIAVLSHTNRRIGGIEQNLSVVLPELERRRHRIAFLYATDYSGTPTAARDTVTVGPNTISGPITALGGLRAFAPDIINVRGDIDDALEAQLFDIAPTVYSVHNYHGTCISGLKSTLFPIVQPCERILGPGCLARYFPKRCGGNNPLTMWARYKHESRRLENIKRYSAVVTHSAQMRDEYLRHGVDPERLHQIPYEVTSTADPMPSAVPDIEDAVHLLYLGRMDTRKGGDLLLRALPRIARQLNRPVHLTLAGDGPDRDKWEALAPRTDGITVSFTGWLKGERLSETLAHTHLLVVPSLWPEPFGKVGPEAALHGIPAAAFDVGGVREWLLPGVNGSLADANPPTAESLTAAIVRCTQNAATYRGLRAGALETSRRFTLTTHVDHLLRVFQSLSKAVGRAA